MTTHRASDITYYCMKLLDQISARFGIKAVYYGNQETFPVAPVVCVLPATIDRDWQGTSLNANNIFQIDFLVYSTGLRTDTGTIQYELDILTEDIADYFNVAGAEANITKTVRGLTVTGDRLGGLVTQGLTTRIEYSYRMLNDQRMRMNRIIYAPMSRTGLVG